MWAAIIPALTTLAGMLLTRNSNGSSAGQADALMTPQMKEILQMQVDRMKRQEPLYQDVMGMARSLLPVRYRRGMPLRPPGDGGSNTFPSGIPVGTAYNPNPHPGDYPGTTPKPGPTQGQPGGWTPPGV